MWWVDFDPRVGQEQAGRRPAIVVGTKLACRLPNHLAIVVPLTSTDRGLPFHPRVTLGPRVGYAMTEQVKSVSLRRLVGRHKESLSAADIDAVRFCLRQMIDVG